jgi:hypothetical protein
MRERTGTDAKFFIGSDWVLGGYIHIKPPRLTPEYERMTVTEIYQRIQDDIEELVARAYPTYTEEWQQKFASRYWQDFGISAEQRCWTIDEKFANKLCPGLWERLKSNDVATNKKANQQLNKLLKKYKEGEPKHAANSLAFATQQAATWLENLSVKRADLLREVAKSFHTWPVNLSVRKDKNDKWKIARLKFARKYLERLEVNTACRLPSEKYTGAEQKSPFRVAAEELYVDMLLMKHNPEFHFLTKRKRGWFLNLTPWAKKLTALSEPMMRANAPDWWRVAKVWIDEQWEIRREVFEPLIRHLKLSDKNFTPSLVKKQVIDDSLKKAFKALAVTVA